MVFDSYLKKLSITAKPLDEKLNFTDETSSKMTINLIWSEFGQNEPADHADLVWRRERGDGSKFPKFFCLSRANFFLKSFWAKKLQKTWFLDQIQKM